MNRTDIAILILLCGLLGALYGRYWQAPTPATEVEVTAMDHVIGRYPLDRPRTWKVRGREGDSVLQIDDRGRVRFLSSPCRNKICIHSGWLSHAGDATACLPNRVSIRLIGGDDDTLDSVSF